MHTVRLPKESTAADVCAELLRQLPGAGRPARLRLLEVFYSKIFKARLPGVCSFACQSPARQTERLTERHQKASTRKIVSQLGDAPRTLSACLTS